MREEGVRHLYLLSISFILNFRGMNLTEITNPAKIRPLPSKDVKLHPTNYIPIRKMRDKCIAKVMHVYCRKKQEEKNP